MTDSFFRMAVLPVLAESAGPIVVFVLAIAVGHRYGERLATKLTEGKGIWKWL